jgi:predicted RNase H-like HicB family nuclease
MSIGQNLFFISGCRILVAGDKSMKFTITIIRDEDGMYIADCPAIPGCMSQGKTEEEAQENIHEAIKECLDVRSEKGMPLTVTTREIEVTV